MKVWLAVNYNQNKELNQPKKDQNETEYLTYIEDAFRFWEFLFHMGYD